MLKLPALGIESGVLATKVKYYRNNPNLLIYSFCRTFTSHKHQKRNLYDILQISPNASQAEVKSAYFRLSKVCHPDVNPASDAQSKFAELTDAYDTLGNVHKRHLYDVTMHRHMPSEMPVTDMSDELKQYRESIRKKFKARHEKRASGHTKQFDFDRFYREHYPEEIARQKMDKEIRFGREESDINDRAMAYNRLYFFMAALAGFAGIMFLSDKG